MTQSPVWYRRIKSWHVAGVILLVAVVSLAVYAFWPTLSGAEPEDEARAGVEKVTAHARVDVMVLKPSDFVVRAEATGHLAPWKVAEISSQATGIVIERAFEEGTYVQQGDLLLQLEDYEQHIALKEAETALLKAQIEYTSRTTANQVVGDDTSRVGDARKDFEAVEKAFKEGKITENELQIARRKYDAVVLKSGAKRDEVESVIAGLSQAEQNLERARLLESRMRVVAPISGRIADVETEVGQRLSVGQAVLRLLDDSRMKVDVNVLEGDLLGLKEGATARVRVPALDNTVINGRIFSINPIVDPKTGTGRVTVSIDNRSRELISGLFAYVELESERFGDRLVIPSDAVLVRQGRDLVFVVKDGRAQWTYVTVGRRSQDLVEITEHLAPGDSIAVGGHHALSHDARVEVGSVVEIGN